MPSFPPYIGLAKDPCNFFITQIKSELDLVEKYLDQLSNLKVFDELVKVTNGVLAAYEFTYNQEIKIALAIAAKPYKAVATVTKDFAQVGLDVMQIVSGDVPQFFKYLISTLIEVERETAKWLLIFLAFVASGNIWNLVF